MIEEQAEVMKQRAEAAAENAALKENIGESFWGSDSIAGTRWLVRVISR